MQGVAAFRNGTLLEEILFAVLSVVHEDEKILKHIQKSFGISETEFLEAKQNISNYYQEPAICLVLKSIRLQNLLNLTGVGNEVACLVRVDETEILTNEVPVDSPEWMVTHEFAVRDLWKSKVEVETWQEQERETKETLTRGLLRSLDLFSKKFRSTLRSENLSALPSLISLEGNRALLFKSKEKGDKSPGEEEQNLKKNNGAEEEGKNQDSESNWVLNAFATLRRPNSSKKAAPPPPPQQPGIKRPAPQPCVRRHLDMPSPIPTGNESFRDGWRARSERSFFSKQDPNNKTKAGLQLSQLNDPGKKSDVKGTENINIKAKSEVNVRRQLFPNGTESSNITEDTNVKRQVKAISVFNPVYNSKPLIKDPTKNCNGDISRDSTISGHVKESFKRREISSGLAQIPSLRCGSLKISPRNEFQVWKRMSLTLRDKNGNLSLQECEQKSDLRSSQMKLENHFATLPREAFGNKTNAQVGSLREEKAANKIKIKIGLSSTHLKDVFVKMNCSEWTAEEESELVLSMPRKEIGTIRPPTLVLSLSIRCQSQPSRIPSSKVFFNCVRHLLATEKNVEVKNGEDYGLCLPMSEDSRLILKCLAFVYNIPEAQISLACWFALTQRSFSTVDLKDNLSNTSRTSPADTSKTNPPEDNGKRDTTVIGNNHKSPTPLEWDCANAHAKFLHNWLTKVEAAASCSYYTEEEEQQIAFSIQRFIDCLCQQFKRIHASFPVNQSSHLAFGLRCICLLAESKSLQSIMKKANLEVGEAWPKSDIMNAVKTHVKNWTEALVSEIQNGHKKIFNSVVSCQDETRQLRKPTTNQPTESPSNLYLMQAIMSAEKAALSVNDFIVLGEKIYETNFISELNESYLEVVWPIITAVLVTLLSPVHSVLHSSLPRAILNTGIDSLQDLHISLWILLLQLSKLQRFQNSKEKEARPLCLPEAFSENFYLLSRLWLDICLFRAKEMVHLECQTDDLNSSENDEWLSSSARELVDLFAVIQEKLSRFAFPSDGKFKENLADFLEKGIKTVVETYKWHVCNLVLDKNRPGNELNSYMCIAANNIERVITEANNVISSLFTSKEREIESTAQMEAHVKDACFFFFTKSLPRVSVWVSNALSGQEKEEMASERLLEWIKSALEPVLDHASMSPVLFRHFWDFVFTRVNERLETDSVPKDYRILGNFMEKLYFFYRITLHVELQGQSQIDFQNFMETVHLKGSSTTDVIQMYYAERYKEQEALTTKRQPLVVNAYFCKDRGLKVEVLVSPYICAFHRRRSMAYWREERTHSNCSSHARLSSLQFLRDSQLTSRVRQRASGVIDWFTKSSGVSFYAKVQPVPANWFGKVKEKKTKLTHRNPPVFEDQLSFNIKCTDEGVKGGGFLLIRLKYSSMAFSGVESEALIPLRDIPLVPFEERRQNKHNFLKLSAPTNIHDYHSLKELSSRKQDKEAISFLSHLSQSFWTTQ